MSHSSPAGKPVSYDTEIEKTTQQLMKEAKLQNMQESSSSSYENTFSDFGSNLPRR